MLEQLLTSVERDLRGLPSSPWLRDLIEDTRETIARLEADLPEICLEEIRLDRAGSDMAVVFEFEERLQPEEPPSSQDWCRMPRQTLDDAVACQCPGVPLALPLDPEDPRAPPNRRFTRYLTEAALMPGVDGQAYYLDGELIGTIAETLWAPAPLLEVLAEEPSRFITAGRLAPTERSLGAFRQYLLDHAWPDTETRRPSRRGHEVTVLVPEDPCVVAREVDRGPSFARGPARFACLWGEGSLEDRLDEILEERCPDGECIRQEVVLDLTWRDDTHRTHVNDASVLSSYPQASTSYWGEVGDRSVYGVSLGARIYDLDAGGNVAAPEAGVCRGSLHGHHYKATDLPQNLGWEATLSDGAHMQLTDGLLEVSAPFHEFANFWRIEQIPARADLFELSFEMTLVVSMHPVIHGFPIAQVASIAQDRWIAMFIFDDGRVTSGIGENELEVFPAGTVNVYGNNRYSIHAERDGVVRFAVEGATSASAVLQWEDMPIVDWLDEGEGWASFHTAGAIVRWGGIDFGFCVPPPSGMLWINHGPEDGPRLVDEGGQQNDALSRGLDDRLRRKRTCIPLDRLADTESQRIETPPRVAVRAVSVDAAEFLVPDDVVPAGTGFVLSAGTTPTMTATLDDGQVARLTLAAGDFDSLEIAGESDFLTGTDSVGPIATIRDVLRVSGRFSAEGNALLFEGPRTPIQNSMDGSNLEIRYSQPSIHIPEGVRYREPIRWRIAPRREESTDYKTWVNADWSQDAMVAIRAEPPGEVSSTCWDHRRSIRLDKLVFRTEEQLFQGDPEACEVSATAFFDGMLATLDEPMHFTPGVARRREFGDFLVDGAQACQAPAP